MEVGILKKTTKMLSQLNGGRDSKKDHKEYLLKKAKEKKE